MSWVRPELIIASDADKASYAFMYEANRLLRISFHRAWYVLAVSYGNDKPNAETRSNANLPFGNRSALWQLRVGCWTIAAQQGPQRLIWVRAMPSAFGVMGILRTLTSMSDSRFAPALIASASQ